jgi:uncharacterized protein
MRRMPALVITCLISAALASPAAAASFDCNKAQKPDEIAICANPALSALDSEMGGLWFAYSQVPFLMGMSGARQDEARAFLQSRATCGANVVCLTQAYHARIKVLQNDIKSAMQTNCTAG